MYTLDLEEIKLINTNNTSRNKLMFAIILKFFHNEMRYPIRQDIDLRIVEFIAKQLGVNANVFDYNYLETRSAVRMRSKTGHAPIHVKIGYLGKIKYVY